MAVAGSTEPSPQYVFPHMPPAENQRVFIDALTDTIFAIGSINDEELLHPTRVAASGDRLFVFDNGDRSVKAYGEDGRLQWKVGRTGGGPGEFRRVRSIAASLNGGVLLVDQTNVRLTELSAEGEIIREVSLRPIEGTPEQVIQVAPDTFLIWTLTRRNQPLTLVDGSGTVVARANVPFEVAPRVPYLGAQAQIANDIRQPERWVYAFSFVNNWRMLDRLSPASPEYEFVEPFPLPEVVFEDRGQLGLEARVGPAPMGAHGVAINSDTVFVLFGGQSRERRRIIDIYQDTTGRYLGSIRLAEPVTAIAVRPGRLALLVNDPFPRIISIKYDFGGTL